jgi:rRNA maturation endonuclease Nob1
MTELGDYKVRCDRCFREADSDNRSPYAVGHTFQAVLTEDPFIRSEREQKQALKWSIEMEKELEMAAKEGRKVKRSWLEFCERCEEYFKKNEIIQLHFCPECVQEMDRINGMGNAAIPLQCVTCRRDIG